MEKVICSKCGADNPTKAKYCLNCGYELPRIQAEVIQSIEPQKVISGTEKKKIYIGVIVGIVFFSVSYFGVQQLFSKSASIDKNMMHVASEINKSCPIMVDSETRLDNSIAIPGEVFQYNYTLVNLEKSKADTASIKNYLEHNIINMVKSSPQMQYQRDHKWTLNYYYKDKDGQYLFLIRITPDKYNK